MSPAPEVSRAARADYDALVKRAFELSHTTRDIEVNDTVIQDRLREAMKLDATRREAPLALGRHLFDLLLPGEAVVALDFGLKHNPDDEELLNLREWAARQAAAISRGPR